MRKYTILCIQQSMFKILSTISTTLSVGKHNPEIEKKSVIFVFLRWSLLTIKLLPITKFSSLYSIRCTCVFSILRLFYRRPYFRSTLWSMGCPSSIEDYWRPVPLPPPPGPVEWINCHGWEDNRCVWKNGAVLYFFPLSTQNSARDYSFDNY